jgi:hypothetical protein
LYFSSDVVAAVIGKCRAFSEMGVFCEEGVDQTRKRAVGDGKGEPGAFHAKTQSLTQRREHSFSNFASLGELCVFA